MIDFKNNKKFIYSFLIGLVISIFLLFSVNIFLLQNDKKLIYSDSIIDFEDSDENRFGNSRFSNDSVKSINHLSFEETKEKVNYELFSRIMDITEKYNVNNISDYQRYDKKYTQFTRNELEENFLSNCSLIESENHGTCFRVSGDYMFFIEFSADGSYICYSRYFNYTLKENMSLDLSSEKLNSLFEIAKNFLDDYSPGISNHFNPDVSYIDDSGTVYVWEDNANGISFSYNLLYNCPCEFYIENTNKSR